MLEVKLSCPFGWILQNSSLPHKEIWGARVLSSALCKIVREEAHGKISFIIGAICAKRRLLKGLEIGGLEFWGA